MMFTLSVLFVLDLCVPGAQLVEPFFFSVTCLAFLLCICEPCALLRSPSSSWQSLGKAMHAESAGTGR